MKEMKIKDIENFIDNYEEKIEDVKAFVEKTDGYNKEVPINVCEAVDEIWTNANKAHAVFGRLRVLLGKKKKSNNSKKYHEKDQNEAVQYFLDNIEELIPEINYYGTDGEYTRGLPLKERMEKLFDLAKKGKDTDRWTARIKFLEKKLDQIRGLTTLSMDAVVTPIIPTSEESNKYVDDLVNRSINNSKRPIKPGAAVKK